MMRAGLYRLVHVKTLRSQKLRMLLTHRKLLQSKAIAIENDLRATLRNFGPVGEPSSRADHHAGGPAQAARGLQRTLLRRRRRPGLLWDRLHRPVPEGRWLRRPHPQGREARRPAGADGNTVISAFGASEAMSIETWSGCAVTSSGSTSIGVWHDLWRNNTDCNGTVAGRSCRCPRLRFSCALDLRMTAAPPRSTTNSRRVLIVAHLEICIDQAIVG